MWAGAKSCRKISICRLYGGTECKRFTQYHCFLTVSKPHYFVNPKGLHEQGRPKFNCVSVFPNSTIVLLTHPKQLLKSFSYRWLSVKRELDDLDLQMQQPSMLRYSFGLWKPNICSNTDRDRVAMVR